MYVHVFLRCHMLTEAMQWADPLPKESYQLPYGLVSELILNRNSPRGKIRGNKYKPVEWVALPLRAQDIPGLNPDQDRLSYLKPSVISSVRSGKYLENTLR